MARFVFAAVATLLLLCSEVARAVVTFTNDEYNVLAGQPFKLTWEGANGPVTITLMNGPDEDLQEVMVIDSSDYGTSFTWTPPYTLPVGTYELRINDGSSEDYSQRFSYPGTPPSSTLYPTPPSPTSTTPRGTVTSTSTAPASPTDAPPAESSTADAPGALSTNAKIGIGVGAGVGAVVLLGLLALCIYRRGRRAGLRAGGGPGPGEEVEGDNDEAKGWEAQPKVGAAAWGGPEVAHEVSGQSHVAEIGSSEWRGHHRMTPAELAAEPYHAR